MRPTAILTIIIFLCLIPAAVAAPLLPSEFYGDITINGTPAPSGTVINATINGQTVGSFVTLSSGVYGGSGTFDQRLSIIGTEDGQSVEFFINGEKANQTSIFHPGITQRLDLTIVTMENTSATNVSTTLSAASAIITAQPTAEVTAASSTSVATQPTGEITPVATITAIATGPPLASISVPETQVQITVQESGQQTAVPTSIQTAETVSVTPTLTPGFTLQSCGIAGILLIGGYRLRRRMK
jgi:hypothetical protein